MTHQDLLPSSAGSSLVEARTFIDDLVRPGLRRIYPLPPQGHANDAKFHQVLSAMAERTRGQNPTVAQRRRSPGVENQQPPDQPLNDRTLVTLLIGTALGGMGVMLGGAYGVSLLLP